MSEWFVLRDEKEHGPFSPNDLKAMAKSGGLGKTDKIRRSDMQKPVLAGAVKGLFVSPEEKNQEVSPYPKSQPSEPKNAPRPKSYEPPQGENDSNKSHKKWTFKKIAIIGGSSLLALLVIAAVIGNIFNSQVKSKISDADNLFAKGSKKEASAIYSQIIEEKFEFIPEESKSKVLSRVVEIALENKDIDGAKKYFGLADSKGVVLEDAVANNPKLAKNLKTKPIETHSSNSTNVAASPSAPNLDIPQPNIPTTPELPKSGINLPAEPVGKNKEPEIATAKTPLTKLDPNNPTEYVLSIGGGLQKTNQRDGQGYELYLSKLKLNYEIANELGNIEGITKIFISDTNFDSKGLTLLLRNTRRLQELVILGTKEAKAPIIFDTDLAVPLSLNTGTITTIRLLDLVPQPKNSMDILMEFILVCPNLKTLAIGNQPISDQDFTTIIRTKSNLQSVFMFGTRITDAGLAELQRLAPFLNDRTTRLKNIGFIDTPVSAEACAALQNELNGCKVETASISPSNSSKSAGNTSPNTNLEKAGEIIAELFVKKMYSGMSETEVKNVIFANTRMQPTKEKEQKFEGKKTKGIFYGDDVMFTFIQIPDTGNYALIGVSVGKESYIAKPR